MKGISNGQLLGAGLMLVGLCLLGDSDLAKAMNTSGVKQAQGVKEVRKKVGSIRFLRWEVKAERVK